MAACRIVVRNTALTESDAPATAMATRPSQSAVPLHTTPPAASIAAPNPAIAKPQPTIDTRIARP